MDSFNRITSQWNFETDGPQVLADVRSGLDANKAAVDALGDAYRNRQVDLAEYLAKARELGRQGEDLRRVEAIVTQAIGDGGAAARGATSAFADYAGATVATVEAKKAEAQAQRDAQAATVAALASYSGMVEIERQLAAVAWGRTRTMGDLRESINATVGATERLDTGMARVGQAASRNSPFGRGMIQAAFLFDDMQYGIGAVVNQVPLVVSALGMGAGMAGALGIVAVATNQVVKHWSELDEWWNGPKLRQVADNVGAIADEVERIKKESDGSAVAAQTLERAQEKLTEHRREQAAFDALKRQPTEDETRSAQAFREQLPRIGGIERLADSLADARRKTQSYFTQEELSASKKAHDAWIEAQQKMEKAAVDGVAPADLFYAAKQAKEAFLKAQKSMDDSARERVQAEAARIAAGKNVDRQAALSLARDDRTEGAFNQRQISALELADPKMLREAEESNRAAQRAMEAAARRRKEAADAMGGDQNFPRVVPFLGNVVATTADDRGDIRAGVRQVDEQQRLQNAATKIADQEREKSNKAAADWEKDVARVRDQAQAEIARKLIGGRGGLGSELTPAVMRRMGEGQDAQQIVEGLRDQVRNRIANIPGVGLDAGGAAEQIIRMVIANQGVGLAAQGGPQQQMAAQFQQMGANQQAAQAMAGDAMALMNKGFNVQEAMAGAMERHLAMAQGLNQRVGRMERWLQQHNRQLAPMNMPDFPAMPKN